MPSNTQTRSFAVIPAAGLSRRMQTDKLLLPWGEGPARRRVIDAVIDAYQSSAVSVVVVVVHPDNAKLIDHCRRRDVEVVVPKQPPAEMKDSVRLGLEYLAAKHQPRTHDRWLLAPADLPTLSPEVIWEVIRAADQVDDIIVPTHQDRRGHPVAFPWHLAAEVATLDANEGVNALLTRHRLRNIECGPAAIPPDIDTPEEYQQLRKGRDEETDTLPS